MLYKGHHLYWRAPTGSRLHELIWQLITRSSKRILACAVSHSRMMSWFIVLIFVYWQMYNDLRVMKHTFKQTEKETWNCSSREQVTKWVQWTSKSGRWYLRCSLPGLPLHNIYKDRIINIGIISSRTCKQNKQQDQKALDMLINSVAKTSNKKGTLWWYAIIRLPWLSNHTCFLDCVLMCCTITAQCYA